MEDCLHSIRTLEPENGIFVRVTEEIAQRQAHESDVRYHQGKPRSEIDGIPLVWKDNINIAGIPTTAGLPELGAQPAASNASVYDTALNAGAVCLAKTSMNEIAFSGLGVSFRMPSPVNPYGAGSRVAGGSSSGTAVAVSRGLALAGIGTDTGGSVRIPAAWNGLVGLKTTAGLLPTSGVVPLSQSMDTIGFIARSVADVATLYVVFSGSAVPDSGIAAEVRYQAPEISVMDCLNMVRNDIDDDVREVYEMALARLSESGVTVVGDHFPEIEEVFQLSASEGNLIAHEARLNWLPYAKKNPGVIPAQIESRLSDAPLLNATQLESMRNQIAELQRSFSQRMHGRSAVLMPTVAIQPPLRNEVKKDPTAFSSANTMALRNTRIANLLGLCAITIPIGRTASGLPVGMMIHGAPYSEACLLRTASKLEKLVESSLSKSRQRGQKLS